MLDSIIEITSSYHEHLVLAGIISTFVFIVSILITPFLLGMIHQDHFINPNIHKFEIKHLGHVIVVIIRTIIGFVLFVVGVIMLVTPGQGVISILLSLFLMEFPGKRKLELKLINHDPTFKTLNWLRARANKPPFYR